MLNMHDRTPAHKQPRLLGCSKEKLESIFNRRKRCKVQNTTRAGSFSNVSSRSKTLQTSQTVVDLPPHIDFTDSRSLSSPGDGDQAVGEKVDTERNRIFEGQASLIRTQKRKGIICIGSKPVGDFPLSQTENYSFAFSAPPIDSTSEPRFIEALANGKNVFEPKQIPKPGPLDHLKLTRSTSAKPRLDQPKPITRISSYVPQPIHVPEYKDKLYRNNLHLPELSTKSYEGTIPTASETQLFVQDCVGYESARLATAKERVPIGARLGVLASPSCITSEKECDGANIVMSTSSIELPPHVRRSPNSKHTYKSISQTSSQDIDHIHTSNLRVAKAYAIATQHLKRKLLDDPPLLSPPADFYQHSGSPTFNTFRDGFLRYPELCLILSSQLPLQTLINLYSISKDFHVIINQRITTVVVNQISLKAPNAARCYPWRCFKHLSQPDPALQAQTTSLSETINSRTGGTCINIKVAPCPAKKPASSTQNEFTHPHTRRVPTFRYLHLAIHREKVIHNLYHAFAARGVPLPGSPTDSHTGSFCTSLHKLWFIFDIPDTARRIQYAHTTSLLSNTDITNILTFIVKLDMICNEPLAAEKRDEVKKMLMSSVNGFDTILKVVKREIWTEELDVLRAWVRYRFDIAGEEWEVNHHGEIAPLGLSREEFVKSKTILGVPREQAGIFRGEFWGQVDMAKGVMKGLPEYGRRFQELIRPDQLVLREYVKRGHVFGKGYMRALLEGYEDGKARQAVPPRDLNGGRSLILEKEGEYELDDAVAGLRALAVSEGGDELLDLGSKCQGSNKTLVHQGPKKEEMQKRQDEKDRLKGYMDTWKAEIEQEKRVRDGMAYKIVC